MAVRLKAPACYGSHRAFDVCRARERGAPAQRTNDAVMERVPIIDLEPLRDGTPAGLAHVASEIGAAARDIGFFAVVNHGVPEASVSELFEAARAF